jgi:hypothetical protein
MNYLKNLIELPENMFYDISNLIKNSRNQIVYAWQRVFRGFDDRMFWGVSNQLSPMMVKVMDWYIKNKSGYPASLTEKEWNSILKQIKEGFEADIKLDKMDFGKDWKRKWDRLEKKRKKGLMFFAKYYADIWD